MDKILSILTPSNIDSLVYDARQMKIDSAESLKQCVDVIFEKAINNENQSVFAILCTKLQFGSVPVVKDSQKMITFKEQICEKSSTEVQNFLERQTLVELRKNDEDSEEVKNSCHRKIRNTIALFRFIGELYVMNFLPSSFIEHSVSQLLSKTFCNENCLESLCALLKIVGEKMEISDEKMKVDLSQHFEILADRKSSTLVKPHTRFMIEEICAMRNNQWQPVSEIDWIMLYNLFLCDVEEKLYVLELWYGKQ